MPANEIERVASALHAVRAINGVRGMPFDRIGEAQRRRAMDDAEAMLRLLEPPEPNERNTYGSSWAGMSMGEGRKVDSGKDCPGSPRKPPSPDGKHHYTAVTNVQSVEHFVCDHCDDDWWD